MNDPIDRGPRLSLSVVIINNGNRPEALLRLRMKYRTGMGGDQVYKFSEGPNSFVLKPAEIGVYRLSADMTEIRQSIGFQFDQWVALEIEALAVRPSGAVKLNSFEVGQFRGVHEPDGKSKADLPGLTVRISESSPFTIISAKSISLN